MISSAKIDGKRVLVTGARGFIGSNLCKRLYALGAEVHVISRGARPSVANAATWSISSMQDENEVQRVLEPRRPEIVFHLSGCVTGSREPGVVMPTFRSNLVSSVTLLTALGRTGCERIILAGSMEEPSPNEAGLASISPYAASKWASSIYARMFHVLYELPVVVLHVFMVYGPGQRDLGKLVPYVTLSFLKGEDPMLSSGERRVDWVYIDDVVEGLIAAALAPGISGRTIDIGTGVLTPVQEVVEELRRQTATRAKPIFGAMADRRFENERSADAEGSWTGLGWKSRVSVQDGLRATVSWYREQLNEGEIS